MIDIIIPAYNAHETIGKTLGSIIKQINRELLHIYIINDGSKKNYDEIINTYKTILNITQITIENSGPGIARQIGLDSSNNEYIVFIDADDTLYNEYSLINLINIIHEADIAQGYFIEKKEENENIIEPQYFYLHGKMYRRSIIEKYNIKFDTTRRYNGDIYEDSSFNQLYMICCNKIETTNEIIYNYEYNPKSITKTNKDTLKNLYNFIDAMTWLENEIEKRKLTNEHEIAKNIYITCFHAYFNYMISNEKNDIIFDTMKKIKKMYNKYTDKLSYEEQLSIYKQFDYPIIPTISFYEFINKIKD